jgi:SAM-dependent methyltransferase
MSYKFLPERTRRKDYTPRLEQSVYFVVKHLHYFILSSLHRYVRANSTVVDIGCGEQPMRTLIEEKGGQYIGVDIAQNSQNTVDIVCSAASIQLPDNSVECILCTEVVEHVSEIDKVFSEFARILKPNGYIILTCPFLYPLHEEPHDFHRPTPYLLEFLAKKYSLTVSLELDPVNILKNFQLWQHAFTSLLKLVAQPVTSLIWSNPSTWGQFKRRLIFKPIDNAPD